VTDIQIENYLRRARDQLAGGFFPLLVLLVVVFVLAPVVDERTEGRVAVDILMLAAAVIAIYVSVRDRRIVLLVLAVAALALVPMVADEIFDVVEAGIPSRLVGGALLVISIAAVMARVIRDERVTLNSVYGAICVYFLLVLFWTLVFIMIEDAEPGSFAGVGAETDRISDFLYFSMVTQTTLGYGDITPVSGLPRSLAALEAFIGQVFLVVSVARLVSLQVAYSGRGGQVDSDPETGQAEVASRGTAEQDRD
jgi:hypothetical protein